MNQARRPLRPRAGDIVEVRSKEEILATLDTNGKFEGMPFMPEMLANCGKRFRVAAVAHKTCDPAHKTGGRSLADAVHLDGLRCDGSAHGGCQAACLIFWKTAWLKAAGSSDTEVERSASALTEKQLFERVHTAQSTPNKPLYSCQATCLYDATRALKWWDVRQYVRDITSGNVTLVHAAKFLVLSWLRALMRMGVAFQLSHALYQRVHRLLVGRNAPETGGGLVPAGSPTPAQELGLQRGQWVRVKPHREIRATLSHNNKNRGMWFDDEATVFCDGRFEVEQRIERIVNEVTGEMMQMKTPCITLKGVHCQSMYSRDRLFCPRAITPYWREIWLEPVPAPQQDARPPGA